MKFKVGSNGVEPFTSSLSEKRSTAELTARIFFDKRRALPGITSIFSFRCAEGL